MIGRRELLAGAAVAGVIASAPALACRTPKPKDQAGYSRVIKGLFPAWLARDYPAFRKCFLHPEVEEPFASRSMFDEHFYDERPRQLGTVMFSGPSAVVQVITVQPADADHGICGGHGWADLMLVKFFPVSMSRWWPNFATSTATRLPSANGHRSPQAGRTYSVHDRRF